MKISSGLTGRALRYIFGIRHFVLFASLIFFIIIGIALILIYQNAQIMFERINTDFNQMQLVLAHQAANQIDSDLRAITREMDITGRHLEAPNNQPLQTSLSAFVERTSDKGVVAAGIINARDSLTQYYKTEGVLLPFDQVRLITDPLTFCAPSALSQLTPFERDGKTLAIYGFLCRQANSTRDDSDILFAIIDASKLVKNSTQNIRSGKTGYAWVVDNKGMFLYHPDNEFIGKNAFVARQEREPYISFAAINEIMKDKMLKGQEGTGTYESGWHRGVEGRVTKLIAYTPVRSELLNSPSQWSVAVAAPTTEVAEAVHGVYVRHIAAEGAIIAAMFIFGILIALYQFSQSEALKQKVSEKEKYISSILGNSLDAIIFIDTENRVKVWNRGAEKIFGYSAEEMLGDTFHKIIPPDIDPDEELKNITDEVIDKGYIRHYLAKRVTKDGRRITIDLSRTLIKNEEGEIIGSTAIIKDVTEKMEFESRIYNTEKLASIGKLAAGVAHEINNPLAIILGFTDLLKEKFEKDSREYNDLSMIEENANNAKKIVEDLLGFARISEGMADITDVGQSLETVINIVKNTLITAKIELITEILSELSEVRGDAREFQQVIFNLINNSISAMERGGGVLTISAREQDGWVNVDIKDTGTGIPEEIRGRIFDPFFTTKDVGRGTGLGLSLCYGIVNKYGGKLTFESTSAEDFSDRPTGTTFTVSLPAVDKKITSGEVADA